MKNRDLRSLTKVYTGGAPTPPGVLGEWQERTGVRIQPMYGLTEATSPTHMTPHGRAAPVDAHSGAMSIGVPVFNTDVKVVTDTGREAGPGEIGEFVIAGPQIIPGYWQKPNETAKALGPDGLRTGDVGFMDEHGWFYLVDRSKDMIIASGFKVWPREVEEVLYQHPAVREAAVVGIPDSYRGETVKASISLKTGQRATADELRVFAREHWLPSSIRGSSRLWTICRRPRAARSCGGCCSRRHAPRRWRCRPPKPRFSTPLISDCARLSRRAPCSRPAARGCG